MAERIVCCPAKEGYVYLYVNTANLYVENITDSVAAVVDDARASCCFDALSDYALGNKRLTDEQDALFSFDFYKLNSFELFKTKEELRLKTGSDEILFSCMLNYYRREYDGTQQYAFFSEPSVSNTYVNTGDSVEHELVLEDRHTVKDEQKDISNEDLETLDKEASQAEREAKAAEAQAELEMQEALLEAEAEADKKEKRSRARKRRARMLEDERYRELRNRDDVQSEEYQRLRYYEEEMRRNNERLVAEYNQGNYSSLPGVLSQDTFSSEYEAGNHETISLFVENKDLYHLASRMDEFGVPYTTMGETLEDGRQITHVIYSTDYAERGDVAKDFYALERYLYYDNVINRDTYYNAYQLNAFEYAVDNEVDTFYVQNGDYSGNQMFKILEAGAKDYDMSVVANPSYSPAHMDVLNYYMSNGWNTESISNPSMSNHSVADNIMREEQRAGIPHKKSFFESHNYDTFLSYGSAGYKPLLSNSYSDSQRQQYLQQKNVRESTNTSRKNNTFNTSYTPTGYIRSDSSFSPYKYDYAPFRPNKNHSGNKLTGMPGSNGFLKNQKYVLNDLHVRNDYSGREGLKVQNHGRHMVGTALGSFRNSFYTVGYKFTQLEETGGAQGARTMKRYVGGSVIAVQLVRDLPNQMARKKQRKEYGKNLENLKPSDVNPEKPKKYISAKEVEIDINNLQKKQLTEIKKKFGYNATLMKDDDILKKISELHVKNTGLIGENRKLKAEIKALRLKKTLTPAEAKLLADKLRLKKANEKIIQKNAITSKELQKLKDLKKKHAFDLKALKDEYKKLAKIEMKWTRLPGRLANSFVMQLRKAQDDYALQGISTASGYAMEVARNPVARSVKRYIKNRIYKRKAMKKGVTDFTKKTADKAATESGTKLNRRKKRTLKRKKVNNKKYTRKKKVRNKKVSKKTGKKSLFKSTKGKAAGKAAGKGAAKAATASSPVGWILAIIAVVIIILFILIAILQGGFASSSFMFTDGDDSEKIDLSPYVEIVNECQTELQSEISDIISGETDAGKPYDNIFYDFNGKVDNNTLEIICMTYVRFSGGWDTRRDEAEAYIKQLYADSNYVDYVVSEPYFCDNGCEEREYKCYDELDEYATETRKSLHASSDHSHEELVGEDEDSQHGCVKSESYSCMEKGHGTYRKNGCKHHAYGAPLDKPCCDNTKVITHNTVDENGNPVVLTYYSCQGYCPGNHYDYSCPGHKEKVCDGEHQDITVTVTCLGFDEIFYADSDSAFSGSFARGDAYEDTFVITGYCSCQVCCGQYSPEVTGKPATTASGTTPKANHTISVDPDVIPLGTHVWIDGKEYVAEDTGGAIEGNRIDIYFDSHSEALKWGKRTKTVYKSVAVEEDESAHRNVIDYLQLAEEASDENHNVKYVLQIFGQAKEPEIEWKTDRVNADTEEKFAAKLQKYDDTNEDKEFSNAELNTFEYVKMSKEELQKLCKERGLNDSGSVYTLITKQLIPYDKDHPEVLVKTDTKEEDLYFEGWTEDAIGMVKNYYEIATADGADEYYTGLDKITSISCGTSSSVDFDFSDIKFDDASGLTNKQQKILAVIESNKVATVSGMCQSWVAHVYQSAQGGAYNSKCCANHAGEAWGVSSDWSNIQVGATVYGYSSSIYGHVGIYIGDGKVAHNIGYLKIQSLESWVNTYNGQCWGWNGGSNLTGKSEYNCAAPGTFMYGKD